MGIWEQLNTRTLFGSAKATAEEVNLQEKNIHLQESNRVLLTDVNLINESLMRDGSPIPGTSEVVSTGEKAEDLSRIVLKTPAAGEVWQVACLSATVSGVVVNFQFLIEDTVNSTIAYITDYNASGAASPINEPGFVNPIHIDENTRLEVNATRVSGTYGTYTAEAYLIRVR